MRDDESVDAQLNSVTTAADGSVGWDAVTEPAIVADGLVKRFGDVEAVKGVSFEVPEGRVLGLLGPNGAGKTTAVRMLTTLLKPDGGTARVLGVDVRKDPQRVRASIGLAGQYAAVDENLTGRENLALVGKLTHLPAAEIAARAAELLEQFALSRRRRPRVVARTRAACAAGSTSRPRWCTGRRCCSSTSPPPASTRRAATSSGASSRIW